MRILNLKEARHYGSSRYVDWVKQHLHVLQQRIEVLNRAKKEQGFGDWKEACSWALEQFDAERYGCEEVFLFSQDLTFEQAMQAIEDLTEVFGKPFVETQFKEKIYTWNTGIAKNFTLQVFSAEHGTLEYDTFMILFHDFALNPENILSKSYD